MIINIVFKIDFPCPAFRVQGYSGQKCLWTCGLNWPTDILSVDWITNLGNEGFSQSKILCYRMSKKAII